MSIEKIERDLRQAIDDFHKYPASDDRCRGALLEFKATCSTENIRALLDELSRLREENTKLRADLAFADEQGAKVETLLETHVQWECASSGCGKPATVHFERGGIGSYYCRECYMRVQALPARALSEEGQE